MAGQVLSDVLLLYSFYPERTAILFLYYSFLLFHKKGTSGYKLITVYLIAYLCPYVEEPGAEIMLEGLSKA